MKNGMAKTKLFMTIEFLNFWILQIVELYIAVQSLSCWRAVSTASPIR